MVPQPDPKVPGKFHKSSISENNNGPSDAFVAELRSCLNHLYDPAYLSQSPVCELLGIGASDRAPRLQRLLESAINALKPNEGQPTGSKAALNYKYLAYRYLQQFRQKEVADQLSVSHTQLYRIQSSALIALATYLWGKHSQAGAWNSSVSQVQAESPASRDLNATVGEPDWLAQPGQEPTADVRHVLADLFPLIQVMFDEPYVVANADIPLDLPLAAVPAIALRQILLNLFHCASQFSAGKQVSLVVRSSPQLQSTIEIEIGASRCEEEAAHVLEDSHSSLAVARELAQRCGAELSLDSDTRHMAIQLVLPEFRGLPILVVDDNEDHIQLLERFTAGTRYRIYSTTNPNAVTRFIDALMPSVVVIDVMMPKTDGWAVLHSLRNHPSAFRLPVVISSIIPASALAKALSADAFLPKPVKKDVLLEILDRLTAAPAVAETALR